MTSIQEVMTANPRTVEPSTPLVEAARLMQTEDVGVLPIVEGDRLTGMITDRDITIRAVAEAMDAQTTTVGQIASRDVVTIDPQQTLDEAARLMSQHQLRRLAVVEEDGRLVGILAQADVAGAGHPELVGEMVEDISQ